MRLLAAFACLSARFSVSVLLAAVLLVVFLGDLSAIVEEYAAPLAK